MLTTYLFSYQSCIHFCDHGWLMWILLIALLPIFQISFPLSNSHISASWYSTFLLLVFLCLLNYHTSTQTCSYYFHLIKNNVSSPHYLSVITIFFSSRVYLTEGVYHTCFYFLFSHPLFFKSIPFGHSLPELWTAKSNGLLSVLN